jgi:hypothetical protein
MHPISFSVTSVLTEPFGEEIRKILIGIDASQYVAHEQVYIAFGVVRPCYSGRFPRGWTDRLCFE